MKFKACPESGLTLVNTLFGVAILGSCLSLGFSAVATLKRSEKHPETLSINWFEILKARANAGEVNAQFNLGLNYELGTGVPRDLAQSVVWFRQAADQNDPEAQYRLGLIYAGAEAGRQNPVEAYAYLNLAARQNPKYSKAKADLEPKLSAQQLAEALDRSQQLDAALAKKPGK